MKQHARAFLALIALASAPVGLASAQVTVTAADPSAAPQGTVSLDVTVSGSGFDSSAAVAFLVTGTTNPGGITVKKVSVKGPKKLIARIDIADDAVVDKFDIEVTLSSGRKGKGTTLFSVQVKTNDPCTVAGLDFPAFVYNKSVGPNRQFYVADSTGQCSRPLSLPNQAGAFVRFSYPVLRPEKSVVGRIAFITDDSDPGVAISAVDFTVNGTVITAGQPYVVVPSMLGLFDYDLSPDGQTLYYVHSSADDVYRLFRVSLPEEINTMGTEVYSEAAWSIGNVSVSRDGAGIFLSQMYWEGPTQPTNHHRLVRIDAAAPDTPAVIAEGGTDHYSIGANDLAAPSRLAYSEWRVCYRLHVADWIGGVVQDTTLQPYARFPTWVNGRILAEGYTSSKRSQCQHTGKIVQIDPNGGAALEVITGTNPDGR